MSTENPIDSFDINNKLIDPSPVDFFSAATIRLPPDWLQKLSGSSKEFYCKMHYLSQVVGQSTLTHTQKKKIGPWDLC